MAPRTIRSFTELVGTLSRGNFAERCDRELSDALDALEASSKEKSTATITVTLTLTAEGGRVDVKPKVAAKKPEDPFGSTPFWATENGLSVQHPSQADLFIRDTTPAAERRG